MNKKYCLVVTDDYSRFTWVLFLATKNETSGILKSFITKVENLVDKKVKIIRCDNGTKFKNRVMSEFCEKKGIKKEFSVARTPQQNGVAERRNKTLIEATRTMVLVVKPHNKTPHELFRGRTPALSFMRPFGCHVTIINTLDYLGKFDGKSDEGFFAGYSMNSKAFRVYNIRTRKVEENFHIRFLEDKPIIAGDGPMWLFDIDVLKKSMNYVPVVTGTNSNDLVDGSLFDSSSKNASNDEPQPSSDAGKKDDESVNKESGIDGQERPENSSQDVNTARPSINTASTIINTGSLNINTSGVHTRRMTKNTNEQRFISAVYEGKLEDLPYFLLLFSYPRNPKRFGPWWIYHMAKEPLVLNGCTRTRKMKEVSTSRSGIDYDEVFALVVRIEAIRLFLAYASFKDFVVYQMDTKSAFLYGKIEEEVYVCQPPGFPDRVYKVEKALYGLHQAPRAWYETLSTYLLDNGFQRGQIDKTLFIKRVKSDILLVQVYVDDIIFRSTKKELCTEFEQLMHKKFQMSSMEISTPMETLKPLIKDENAEDIDVLLYRSMIGSLMYLKSSRPDIMFDITKRTTKIEPVYPKDSPFDLEAYTDSDYTGASLDRKSTIGADEAASTGVDVRYGGATTTYDTPRINGFMYNIVKEGGELGDRLEGRKIVEIDQDPAISLVQHDVEIQERHEHDMEFDFDLDAAKDVNTAEKDEGKIQKDKKKPRGAKGKDKGKNKLAYDPKPKIPPPPKRDNPKKNSVCHHYREVTKARGAKIHWGSLFGDVVLKSGAVMSSASSAVTYTSIYTNSKPGRPVAPPSPDYIPDSEEPQTPPVPQDEDEHEPIFIQPHAPDYVPEPMYPEYIPLERIWGYW
ncbi:putative ribonuclease H-like domain-containing protein [Tanacetum coccineum]